MTDARQQLIHSFLADAGWADALRHPLAGDASARRYLRLTHGTARAVLMDADRRSGELFDRFVGVGLWLSAMNVQFRDVRYTVPFLTQFWMFITPIAYPSSLIESDALRAIYSLNPMAGVVEGFRWALLGTDTAPGPMILVSSIAALVLLISGLFYFRRMERKFADVG